MPYYSKKLIVEAREMELLTYLRCYNPGELAHISPMQKVLGKEKKYDEHE